MPLCPQAVAGTSKPRCAGAPRRFCGRVNQLLNLQRRAMHLFLISTWDEAL